MLRVIIGPDRYLGKKCVFHCPKCGERYTFIMGSKYKTISDLPPTTCSKCYSLLPAVYGIIQWHDARIRYHFKKPFKNELAKKVASTPSLTGCHASGLRFKL